MKLSGLEWVVYILVIVGAINWGLFSFGFNLVELIFMVGWLINLVYWLVGLSGLYLAYLVFKK